MLYSLLTTTEKKEVETKINTLLGSSILTDVFNEKVLISLNGSRKGIFLISKATLDLLTKIDSNSNSTNCRLIHACIKLGFFIRDEFRFGIESLSYLAPLTKKRINLNARNTQKFIFGKDIEVTSEKILLQIKEFVESEITIIFSDDDIPIGFGKITFKEKKPLIQNLVDCGIYIRSEKSAF